MVEAALFAAGAGLASYLLTHAAARVLPRLGLVSAPDPNHPKPVPVGGGIVLWAVVFASLSFQAIMGHPVTPLTNVVLAATCLFLAGLWDDARPMAPRTKVLIQVAAASGAVISGVAFPPLGPGLAWAAAPMTVLWFVALCNAFNLIDNMDGMLPGVAATAAVFIGFFAFLTERPATAFLAWTVAGACLGFLRHNLPPARILLGDSGSMFLGFLLAGLAIGDHPWRGMTQVGLTIVVPAMLLAIPIFNATFVTVTRKLQGIPVSRGKADHINYRLLAHGLSRSRALGTVYALCIATGALGLLAITVDTLTYLAGAALFLVLLVYLAAFLHDGRVDQRLRDFRVEHSGRGWDQSPWYRWVLLIVSVSGDVLLVFASLFAAFQLRFDGAVPDDQLENMATVLPYLILFRVGLGLLRGVYDTRWSRASFPDAFRLAGTVALGSLLFAALVTALKLPSFPRTVVALEGLITVLFLAGTRLGVRRLGELAVRKRGAKHGMRTIVAGASDAVVATYRELATRNEGEYHVIGFVEEDPRAVRGRVHGVRVLGPVSKLTALARLVRAEHVILAFPKESADAVERHLREVLAAGMTAEVVHLEIVAARTWLGRRPAASSAGGPSA